MSAETHLQRDERFRGGCKRGLPGQKPARTIEQAMKQLPHRAEELRQWAYGERRAA